MRNRTCPRCAQRVELPLDCIRWWCDWRERDDGSQVHLFLVARDEYRDEDGGHFRTPRPLAAALDDLLKPQDV